jgi:hypothetical protein
LFDIEEEGGFSKAIEAIAKAEAEAKGALNLVARL